MEPTMDDVAHAAKEAFARINRRFDGFADAQAKRHEELKELTEKTGEFQARLLELEQQAVRRRHGGGEPGADVRPGALSQAADDLLAGLQTSNNARILLPSMSLKRMASLSSDAPGAGGTQQYAVPPENLGALSTYHPSVARLIDLLPPRPVTGNSLTYTRISYADDDGDSPPGAANAAAKVAELAAKPESHVKTIPITVEIPTFAHWIRTSKQILDDVTELRGILDGILRGGLLDVVDADIYNTLKTSGNYSAFNPESGETIGDAIARVSAQIANQGGAGIIVALNPLDYLNMQLAKADSSGNYLGMPPNLASRVVSVAAVAQSKILAFAPTSGASWADREGVSVVLGLNNDDFTKNAVTALCESRGATLVRDPAHVAYGNVTAA